MGAIQSCAAENAEPTLIMTGGKGAEATNHKGDQIPRKISVFRAPESAKGQLT